ncbi:MAG: hypothetical protein GX044_02830 [Firmicutes bacterium]|jgi:CBS domain-containing protein|nr:hypothetical protein [Bacillota bacterium]
MEELSNAERFLNAYAVIEHEMQKLLDLKEHRRFSDLVHRAAKINPVIEQFKFDLKEFGDLRNAIVHDRAGGKVIAEPNDEVVAQIEKIAALLLEPPKVLPLFRKKVLLLAAGDPVSRAVKEMSLHGFTQIPVLERDTMIGLLTSHMVIKWMGRILRNGMVDLGGTTLGELIALLGKEVHYRIVPPEASLFDILNMFCLCQAEGQKLESVLITDSGDSAGRFLGIITNRDLPLVHRELGI